jgi:hypothetical protein
MRFTQAEAVLSGAGVAGFFTLLAVLVTHFASRRREHDQRQEQRYWEHEHRLWERRANVFDDVMTEVHKFASVRETVMDSEEFPEYERYLKETDESFPALAGRIELYSTDELLEVHAKMFDTRQAWMAAWRKYASRPLDERLRDADPRWQEFSAQVAASRKADVEVVLMLRKYLHSRVTPPDLTASPNPH